MYNTGYPTAKFTWTDNSGASGDVLFSAPEGLNVPFGFIMAERGAPGEIYYGGAAELVPILGSETFEVTSQYYNPATQFIGTAIGGQGACVMRLVDPDATTSSVGLFAEVTLATVVQYEKDVHGARIVDGDGDFVPLLDENDAIVSEPGVKVTWTTRELTGSETFNTLTRQTVTNGGVTKTIYPITAIEVLSPGAYGDRQGFSLSSSRTEMASVANEIKSVLYRFVPMALPTRVSTTASVIRDIFGEGYSDISFKDVAIDPKTGTNYAARNTLGSNFYNTDRGETTLPYNIHTYGAYVKEIGELVVARSDELDDLDPYLVDLISGRDLEGNHFDHLEVSTASASVVNSDVTIYARGGSDGEVSFTKLQELMRDWLAGTDHGEFRNLQQHPITHYTDPGLTMETKILLFNMLGLRDNIKIDVSTQDALLPPNTKAQDLSAGQTLMFRAQMHPESTINGVGCSRVSIFAHTAELVNGSPYGGSVPFTLNRLIQRRDLDGASYIKGSSGGRPNSDVTIFRKPNWTADDEEVRKLSWGQCLNVVMHATRTDIFYPSLRTVYPNDTSLLSDDEIADRVVYMFKICRSVWATYAGRRELPNQLFSVIEDDINDRCATAFDSDGIRVQSTVYQTARDADLGYAYSVTMALSGNLPMRQMTFDIELGRLEG